MSCCAASRQAVAHGGETVSGAPAEGRKSAHAGLVLHADATAEPTVEPARSVVQVPGGTFWMGSEDGDANPHDGEGPVRKVTVAPFGVGRFAVTNREFAGFVAETGYVTEAEEFGWSFVFAAFLPGKLRAASPRPQQTPWWCAVDGAVWSAPRGPGSSLTDLMDHPVVHVSWRDAEQYAHWAGGTLPTETQWEYAARGGLDRARHPWGDELVPDGEHQCNIWQGTFPTKNTAEDGYRGTAPVDAYQPNGFGLYNTAGNVWEMCADYWTTDHPEAHNVSAEEERRVMRGGSYLCHDSYCNRYRVAARTSNGADSSSGNQGFRVVFPG